MPFVFGMGLSARGISVRGRCDLDDDRRVQARRSREAPLAEVSEFRRCRHLRAGDCLAWLPFQPAAKSDEHAAMACGWTAVYRAVIDSADACEALPSKAQRRLVDALWY